MRLESGEKNGRGTDVTSITSRVFSAIYKWQKRRSDAQLDLALAAEARRPGLNKEPLILSSFSTVTL